MSSPDTDTHENESTATGVESLSAIPTGKQLENETVSLEVNPSYDLQQRDVARVMLSADQPYFSIEQLRSRLKSNPSQQTIRRRLSELDELGIVTTEEFRNHSLYCINDARSAWGVPGDLPGAEAFERATLRDLATFRAPRTLKQGVQHAGAFAMYLVLLGAVVASLGVSAPISSSNGFITAALLLMIAVYPLYAVQLIVDKAREVARDQ